MKEGQPIDTLRRGRKFEAPPPVLNETSPASSTKGPMSQVQTLCGNLFSQVIGTFMGRDALWLAASLLDLRPDDTVLLPGFLCGEVLKPFAARCRVQFYDPDPTLAANPEEIAQKIQELRPRMLMLIHYFGFLQPHRLRISQLCREAGVVLVEDCAHSLLTQGSGESGDISIYSFRKLLPVPDGGGLQVKGRVFTPDYHPRIFSNALSILILLKLRLKVRSEVVSRAGIASRTKSFVPKTPGGGGRRRVLQLSSFASRGIRTASFQEICERRRGDYLFWEEWNKGSQYFQPLFPSLPEEVCPLGFPVRVKNRDSIKARLRKRGVFLKTHWNLPQGVPDTCANSHALSQVSLTLPVYPEVSDQDRDEIISAFRAQ